MRVFLKHNSAEGRAGFAVGQGAAWQGPVFSRRAWWHAVLLTATVTCVVGGMCAMPAAAAPSAPRSDVAATAPDDQAALRALLRAFAQMPGLEASFVEEKHIGMLAAPLRSQGTLYYLRGGYMVRRLAGPAATTVTVTPTELKVSDGTHVQRFDLRTNADMGQFVESFLWVLAGDEAKLREAYVVAFQRDAAANTWTMTLTPKRESMRFIVRAVVVEGAGQEVRVVRVQEASGDETVTRIQQANPDRRFSADELQTLFGVSRP